MRETFNISPEHISSLPGPDDILRTELPNGIVVLARANFNSPSVTIAGSLSAGNLFDPDEKLGLATFTASALLRGTTQHEFQDIYNTLETIGAGLGFSGGTHTTGFHGRALSEDLDLLMSLAAEALRNPAFPAQQIERLRAQFMTGLAIRAQSTSEMASLAFDQLVYDGHPYSRPEDGYPETVGRITREDLAEFHQKYYGPRGMIVIVVGGVDPAKAVEKVAQALGDWDNPEQPDPPDLPPVRMLTETVTQKVEIPGKSQTDLVMGTVGPHRKASDYLAASIGNSIFGQFGMYGRIGDAVREQAGLAYYAYSSMGAGIGPGPWSVSAGIAPENLDRVIGLIKAEIERFVQEPVTAEELEDSKAHFIGRLPLSLESNGGVAGALLKLERYQLGLDYYQHYTQMIDSITSENVLDAARHYLHPDRLAIAVAG